jgi:hypothetical protein
MSFKLPFKSKEVVTEYVTVSDEFDNNELTLPVRPFSYKDSAWFKENAEVLSDESNQEEANFRVAEYYLRSRLDVPEEITRDKLFRYESGEPFSLIFVMRLAESFANQVSENNKKVEGMINAKETESGTESKRGNKGTRKGVQKDG